MFGFDPFGLATHWFQLTASGLVDAVWQSVWHWGLGIGVIILCILGAIFVPLPNAKEIFALAAACTFCLLVAYYAGDRDRARICTAQVKEIYLKAHPGLNSKNLAKNWRVSPSWDPSKPPRYRPLPQQKSTCSPGGWGC